MKKFLSVITAVAVILSMASYSASAEKPNTEMSGEYSDSIDTAGTDAAVLAEEETASKFSFTLLNDGTYEISCPEENKASLTGELVIPATYNGKPVSTISSGGFSSCQNITSVVIENGITTIEDFAISLCSKLETIYIPESVVSTSFSFAFNNSLNNFIVDKANRNFCSADGILFSKDMQKLVAYPAGRPDTLYTVPDGVKVIGDSAFSCCFNLVEAILPEGVTQLENNAFSSNPQLRNVNIPASVTALGNDNTAFTGCVILAVTIDENNNSFCIEDGVIFSKDKTRLVTYLSSKTDVTYEVPAGVKKIDNDALSNNQNIRSLVIPEAVTDLGFIQNCWYLNTLTLPKSLTRLTGIGGLDRLSEIKYGGTKADWNALIADLSSSVKENLNSVNVSCTPGEIDETTGLAFELLDDGTYAVSCPESLKTTLSGELVIPAVFNNKPVTTIAELGFDSCRKITSAVIPEGVTTILRGAFGACYKLDTVSIPKSVSYIEHSAFLFSEKLTEFSVDEANADYCSKDGVLFTKDMEKLVAYPAGKPDTSYTVPNGVKVIGDFSFGGCDNLESVIIPEGVTILENRAFGHSTSIKSVNIPASVTTLGYNDNVFFGCENIEVTISEDNKNFCIEDGVIFNKDKTELVIYLSSKKDEAYEVPASVRVINGDAFSMNQHIKSLVLNEGLPQFCNIQNCWNLKSITIPKSVTIFEGISGMDSFKEIFYGGTIDEWFSVKSNHRLDPDGVLDRVKVVCSDGAIGIDPEVTTLETGDIEFKPGIKENDVPDLNVEAVEVFENLSVTAPEAAKLDGAELFAKLDTEQKVINTGIAMDLTFMLNGKKVQPEGEVAVTFPIPESLKNAEELFIYHITEDNKVEQINMGGLGGLIGFDPGSIFRTFLAKHFSTYVITDKEYGTSEPADIVVDVEIDLPEIVDASTLRLKADLVGTGGDGNEVKADENGKFILSGFYSDGDYQFMFWAENCATRIYENITISDGKVTGLDKVELHLIGDINGDGKLTLSDVLKANAAARNSKPLTGYEAAVADINNDGNITLGDVLKMNAHARNSKLLW